MGSTTSTSGRCSDFTLAEATHITLAENLDVTLGTHISLDLADKIDPGDRARDLAAERTQVSAEHNVVTDAFAVAALAVFLG